MRSKKEWKKTGHRVNVKKNNEYLTNLPSQKPLRFLVARAPCGSVRIWNVLFVGFLGVELSFPFPPSPSSSTPPHLANLAISSLKWLAQRSAAFIYQIYPHIRCSFCYRRRHRCLHSKPHVNRPEVGILFMPLSHLRLILPFLFFSFSLLRKSSS